MDTVFRLIYGFTNE